jgi:hypothetical protein
MGYDVHIVRTEHWTDAAGDPITKDEVDALVASDPELSWSGRDWVDMSDDGGNRVTRYYAILWKGEPCFFWRRDQITCSGPSEDQVGKMVEMAASIGARARGDDGEVYRPDMWRAVYRGELKE